MRLKKNPDLEDKRILIVEDELMCFKLIEIALKHTRAKLLRANNGKEAIERCAQDPGIDLVLMDIQLPVINGYQATDEIRKFNKKIPIIAQTAYAMNSQRQKCFEAGCTDYISKPYNTQQLLSTIGKYI